MFSLTVTAPKTHVYFSSAFLSHGLPVRFPTHHSSSSKHPLPKPISATIIPSNPSQQQPPNLYQPFRPPPSPLPPKFRSLDTNSRLEILANRLGLWYEYAPIVPSLAQEGFTPSTIEELTGISGVEQNRLIVASQVRDTLVQSQIDPETLSFFDSGGAELLYEIRLLSATQRVAAVRYLVENKLDAKGAQDLARSMKDFPRRRGDPGWECFNYNLPGDCLSFMYYRQALEYQNPSEQRTAALKLAVDVAASEAARMRLLEDLEVKDGKKEGEGDEVSDGVRVPVVRMKVGEVAESSVVAVLPVCRAEEREREVVEAPWECGSVGDFGIVSAEKSWSRWVVLPGWAPVAGLKRGGVAVAFADARALPWKVNRWYKEEAILVVADRGRKAVEANDGFYLVAAADEDDGLKIERGTALNSMGVEESLGTVVLVVRPPRDENDDQLADDEWD